MQPDKRQLWEFVAAYRYIDKCEDAFKEHCDTCKLCESADQPWYCTVGEKLRVNRKLAVMHAEELNKALGEVPRAVLEEK